MLINERKNKFHQFELFGCYIFYSVSVEII
jgi:hypothetical protein